MVKFNILTLKLHGGMLVFISGVMEGKIEKIECSKSRIDLTFFKHLPIFLGRPKWGVFLKKVNIF